MQLISFSPFQCIFGDVFIWFEWIFLLWFLNKKNFFLTTLCSMWDLCSPTRDQTLTPCTGSTVLTTGLPEESLLWFFKWLKNSITIEFHMQNTVFTAKIWVSTQNNEKIEFIALCFDFDSILLFIEFFLPGPFKLLIQVIFDLIVSNFINKFAFISKYFSASFVLGIVQGLRNMKMMEQSTSPSEPWTLFLSQSDCIPLHPFFPPFFCPFPSHVFTPVPNSTENVAFPSLLLTTEATVWLEMTGVGTSLTVQWLRLHLPMQAMQVWSLVRELRSHMPQGQKNKNPKYKTEAIL